MPANQNAFFSSSVLLLLLIFPPTLVGGEDECNEDGELYFKFVTPLSGLAAAAGAANADSTLLDSCEANRAEERR